MGKGTGTQRGRVALVTGQCLSGRGSEQWSRAERLPSEPQHHKSKIIKAREELFRQRRSDVFWMRGSDTEY